MARGLPRKRHRQSAISLWYQTKLRRSPFLFFGLPFLTIIVGGSFALTNFTTIRYERHDEKVKITTEEEVLKLDKDRRRPDIREEYYRLLEKDLDNWEQKRITRLKGEPENVMEPNEK